MRPLESLRLAWRSIRGHRLRSTLTTLGAVIGVAAVIAFVALGASLQAGIVGDISPDGQRNIYGWAAPPDTEGGPLAGAQPAFSQRDVEEPSARDDVDAAYEYTALPTQSIAFGDERSPQRGGLVAAGPSYVREADIAEGRQFREGEREAVITPATAGLFSENVTLGDELSVTLLSGQRVTVTVVGITESSEGLSPFEGVAASSRVSVPTGPYYTEQSEGDEARYVAIVVEADSAADAAVDRARESALEYLESDDPDTAELARGGDGEDDPEFTLRTSTELLQQLRDVLDLLRNFVVGIAAISLVVGSIGIANIMLVSVTERTREIGIMKAVGAQNRDVLALFLAEAVVLGVVGAAVGTGVGLVAAYLGAEYVDLPVVYPLEYAALAIVGSVLVGVVPGLYPAWRGERTDPIDALRYE